MAPSGTAPSTGRTTEPTMPAAEGIKSRSSEPSDMRLDPYEAQEDHLDEATGTFRDRPSLLWGAGVD
eukprot:CAMPEP_0115572738 /NCGR_PEP_ID=MMETSP0272-20121206/630_1 /TAXON_ID=71861 /ORGANISM="Scrippsiella trochoidea, Strain CCMP3099" /LENGTH=66 /DNA_ID=CAMNT_0003007365 /DNA_START=403 /DNA_END=601 /DNA_ORIENTATION=+